MGSVLFRICLANFALVAAVFMQFAALMTTGGDDGADMHALAVAVSVFALGLFALGPVSSCLLSKYQRKSVYKASLLALMAVSAVLYLTDSILLVALVRFVQGALCGLAQVALGSTLLNDLTVSEKRTRHDYFFAWTALLAIPSGMALALLLSKIYAFDVQLIVSLVLMLLSVIVVQRMRVPFRAPISTPLFSYDRFWQKNDLLPFLNLMIYSMVFGIFIAANFNPITFVCAAMGVLIAHPFRRMVFANADVRAEIVTGMIFMLAAMLIPMATSSLTSLHVAAVMFGVGVGLGTSRFLLYFLKLTGHCQRGTAQNTYMLSRECGYALGFVIAYFVPAPLWVALPAMVVSIIFYLVLTHPWFLKHNDRYFKFREF